jgi:hypothetical protein
MSGELRLSMVGTAEFSHDVLGQDGSPVHRYYLSREWNADRAVVNFIGLNPSTADAGTDDPTIRRCIGFARRWGFGKLAMTNLYPHRATDPRQLQPIPEVVGHINARWLKCAVEESSLIVAAWGAGANPEFAFEVWSQLSAHNPHRTFRCLGRTKDGSPRHPLYLPAITELEPWP